MSITDTAFTYVVNHIFLPPKLPGGDDWEATLSMAMQSTMGACIEKFEKYVALGSRALVQSAASMIRRMAQAQDENGYVHCDKLEQALGEIGKKASLLMEGLLHQDLASDIIETMRSKVARRKHKLLSAFQGQVDKKVISFADKVMTDAARELVNRQCHLVANESPDNNLRCLESVNFVSDTVHRLKKLDDFINSISGRTLSQRRASFCPPTCIHRQSPI
ncbi:uncharacterized protein PpBr36_10453 [Pyricularia pennisetigena]|uniref:uncharacterized protein n=1 Tax=Pyricularia pennisetigena TaxID=1578925 RepID=UPI001154EF68|nr:uncharacterized protein PpBr36_10453 [Pyricularia pennisetigena]TLS21248.1 hypothetical protein PpBr36_10453 [Pyricularia pennisetigena]